MGADDPTKCQLDATAHRRSRVFVDTRETAEANGDVHRAISAGRYSVGELAGELGEVLSGQTAGLRRTTTSRSPNSSWIGAQDLVAAEVTLAKL